VTPADRRWSVAEVRGGAAALHEAWPHDDRHRRRVARRRLSGSPAVVLGTTQRGVVDTPVTRRIEVVRRRTGGGAVWVAPQQQVWLDVWVPRHDPLWNEDVVRGAFWLGRAWCDALTALGAPAVSLLVHEAGLVRTPASSLVCFAGVGPGEVVVDGRKVMGLAQRRSAEGTWLQTVVHLDWEPASLVAALEDLGLAEPDAPATVGLGSRAVGLCRVVGERWRSAPATELITACEDAVIAALP
jgi:lipoate---protein ligase